jgi:hypothetical protein
MAVASGKPAMATNQAVSATTPVTLRQAWAAGTWVRQVRARRRKAAAMMNALMMPR